MGITYNSNISAMRMLRQQSDISSGISRANVRLSSGSRINSARDDPAGLSLSSSLAVSARVAKRGRLNIQDGESLLAIADGVFSTVSTIVTRMSELANQAANGSLTSTQRAALQLEMDALGSEINRIGDDMQFNGRYVVRGDRVARSANTISGISGTNSNKDAISNDGRYYTYYDGTTLKQRDLQTSNVTTITAAATTFSASGDGEIVVYYSGSNIYKYDRSTGSSSVLKSVTGIGAISLSNDGSTLALMSTESFTSAGVSQGSTAGYAFSTIDLVSGTTRGDGGVGKATRNAGILAISQNGQYIAAMAKDTAYSASTEAFVFATSNLASLSYRSTGITPNALMISNQGTLYMTTTGNAGGANSTGHINIMATSDGATYRNITNIITGSAGSGVNGWRLTDGESTISFAASNNIAGQNPNSVSQAYKVNLSTGALRMLTNYTTAAFASSSLEVSGDGYTWIMTNNGLAGHNIYDLRQSLSVQFSTGTSGNQGTIATAITGLDSILRGVEGLDISTQRGGRSTLTTLQTGLAQLGLAQSELGSAQARLLSASRVSADNHLNGVEAGERITNIDVAEEAAGLLRLQILAEDQTRLLAQATQLNPRLALDLLYGATNAAL